MKQIQNKKTETANKKYTLKEVEKLKQIIEFVTVESDRRDRFTDFNDWGNHNEYTRGW